MSTLSDEFLLMRRLRMKIDLIPGPPHDDATLYNHAIQVIARYPGAEIAAAFDRMPRVRTVTDGARDACTGQWVWRDHDRSIRFGFSTLHKAAVGKTDSEWGGSTLELDCYVGDLLGFWANFRATHPDTWLHYDGRVYTPDRFVGALRDMLENMPITDIVRA